MMGFCLDDEPTDTSKDELTAVPSGHKTSGAARTGISALVVSQFAELGRGADRKTARAAPPGLKTPAQSKGVSGGSP